MNLNSYISNINQRHRLGNATEHTFRGDLQQLLETMVPEIRATNEPKRQSCGAPDYIITKGEIPVGFIEAKDIGDSDLEGKKKTGNQEQFDRYKTGLSNLIITDYIEFLFYKDGILNSKISIGKLENGNILPVKENFEEFKRLFKNFTETISQSIKSPTRLAEMMAGRARLMADIIEKSLNLDDQTENLSNLKKQMLSFQQMLISDIDNKSFSDLYSQTIAYGMFAARYHDPSLENFSREEAVKLIPKSNPFLRKLFKDIADEDLDIRLNWIIDELVSIFLASDVLSIMKDFGKSTKQEDPVVHFYETFLGAYNPELRKARGVWYTPQPVVNFIVRAVDDILKSEFDLPEGLADSSKKKIKVNLQGRQIEKEVHKVQILDPATGTGTFLAETIKHIHSKYVGMQGIWSKYVEDDLIPRINGFELLMASYAMAHLKLDMLLTETGYIPTRDQRLRVFLTNSLEEAHPDSGTLWGSLLSEEADQANEVKRDTPVMCIIGNPPYAVSSSNKNLWIQNLIADYKKNLNERKINLDDDYIKFIRYGQHYIDKNGFGILAYISNNSFIDGVTHRQMRKHLLESFDKIYIIDLHGNAKKREVCTDGSADINVFDIMQGVSINIFVKTSQKKQSELGKVFHFDLQGKREFKYQFLNDHSIMSLNWKQLKYSEPYLFFVPKNFDEIKKYESGFSSEEIFIQGSSGIETMKDELVVSFDNKKLEELIDASNKLNFDKIKSISNSIRPEQIDRFFSAINNKEYEIREILYRPFDYRKIFYWKDNSGVMWRNRGKVMAQLLHKNIGIGFSRTVYGDYDWQDVIINSHMVEKGFMAMRISNAAKFFPLYIYSENNSQQTIGPSSERIPNLNLDIVKKISAQIGLTFTNEKETIENTFAPIDILDYIYGVLHSPSYRENYKEFLKIDFPRIPYPNIETFWKFVNLGGNLRKVHLLEGPVIDNPTSTFPHVGSNVVDNIKYENGKVHINETQCFENVPLVAWNLYIGGYQPAQKWLKDRKDRELQIDDIRHYMKIIVALSETDRLMKEIDKITIL